MVLFLFGPRLPRAPYLCLRRLTSRVFFWVQLLLSMQELRQPEHVLQGYFQFVVVVVVVILGRKLSARGFPPTVEVFLVVHKIQVWHANHGLHEFIKRGVADWITRGEVALQGSRCCLLWWKRRKGGEVAVRGGLVVGDVRRGARGLLPK